MSGRVAVIGAGYAGCAAALTLAAAGQTVTVFDAAPRPGGRARQFPWRGVSLDNGQHLLLGAYEELLRLLETAHGHRDLARMGLRRAPLTLSVAGEMRLQAWRLPAPFNMLGAILTARGLSAAERFALARFMRRVPALCGRGDTTVADLLAGERQPPRLIRLLWEPLCLAALNTPLRAASAQTFLNVLRDSLLRRARHADLLLPTVGLGELFPEPALRRLAAAGHAVRLGERVRGVAPDAGGVNVACASGDARFDAAVVAVGPHQLRHLDGDGALGLRAVGERFAWQPITTVYLQYPSAACLPDAMTGLSGGLLQWVFDRGRLGGPAGLFAGIISAEGPHLALDAEALGRAAHRELAARWPLPEPLWHKTVTEKRATYACAAGLERPGHATSSPRLWLAGDYTAGPYPATLETAVRSGAECARQLLRAGARNPD